MRFIIFSKCLDSSVVERKPEFHCSIYDYKCFFLPFAVPKIADSILEPIVQSAQESGDVLGFIDNSIGESEVQPFLHLL